MKVVNIDPKGRDIVVVPDIHSQYDELADVLSKYPVSDYYLVFLGDLADSELGGDPVSVYKTVMDLVRSGDAIHVLGNHDDKLRRFLKKTTMGDTWGGSYNHGLAHTIEELLDEPPEFRLEILRYLEKAPHVAVYTDKDGIKHVFAHGGIHPMIWKEIPPEKISKRLLNRMKSFSLYGEVDYDMRNDDGFPVRKYDWTKKIPDNAHVYIGHDYEVVSAHPRFHPLDSGVGKKSGEKLNTVVIET